MLELNRKKDIRNIKKKIKIKRIKIMRRIEKMKLIKSNFKQAVSYNIINTNSK